MASGSGVRTGSVKNSSAGRAFRSLRRAGKSRAVRSRVQKPEMSAAPTAEGYRDVVARIARAAQAAGRDPSEVALVAVSKMQSWDAIAPVLAAGHSVFGENRVQEAMGRWEGRTGGLTLHLIGPLQTNKSLAPKIIQKFLDLVS